MPVLAVDPLGPPQHNPISSGAKVAIAVGLGLTALAVGAAIRRRRLASAGDDALNLMLGTARVEHRGGQPGESSSHTIPGGASPSTWMDEPEPAPEPAPPGHLWTAPVPTIGEWYNLNDAPTPKPFWNGAFNSLTDGQKKTLWAFSHAYNMPDLIGRAPNHWTQEEVDAVHGLLNSSRNREVVRRTSEAVTFRLKNIGPTPVLWWISENWSVNRWYPRHPTSDADRTTTGGGSYPVIALPTPFSGQPKPND